MPIADSTKIEVVNSMLTGAGLARTADLSSSAPEVIMAVSILDTVDREVQSRGWYFGREFEVVLTLNGSDQFALPVNVFTLKQHDPPFSTGTTGFQVTAAFVKRGGFVYDMATRTDVFTGLYPNGVSFDWIVFLDFTDLPETARSYIEARAARRFFRRVKGGDSLDLQEGEVRAFATLNEEDARVANYNAFRNPDTIQGLRTRHRNLPRH